MDEAVKAIDEKIAGLQKQYNEVMSKKNEAIQQIKKYDEELQQMVGAYKSLSEVKMSLTTPPVVAEKNEEVEETPVIEEKQVD